MKAIFLLLLCVFFTSCSTLGTGINKLGYEKIDDANTKIAQIETQKDAQIKLIEDDAKSAQNDIINKQIDLHHFFLYKNINSIYGVCDQIYKIMKGFVGT